MSNAGAGTIETRIPARLDRLPWSRFHWLVVIGLGTVWILDGLEVTIVGSVASRLTEKGSGIAITDAQIGVAAAAYVAGACLGALFFGQLTDRFGRKKLFLITLGVYILATFATAFAFSAWYFFVARFFTGAGIGGEYAAINSAIDELIPARVRGRVDLIINGSFWVGAAVGSALALLLLDTRIFPADIGWRIAFLLGVVLGLGVLIVRRHVPESPRWLFIHGREEEAEEIVDRIEGDVREETGTDLPEPDEAIEVHPRTSIPFREIASVAFTKYPRRAILALALFVGQAFLYNGVTFNLGTLFSTFYGISSSTVPVFVIAFAVANFMGPLFLGRLFDTVGRKAMISFTYLGSAVVAAVAAWLFANHYLHSPWAFEALIMLTFFLASAGASSAYLTASEIFPMETRALAIAFFYAVGTAAGGITGPLLFGRLIESASRDNVAIAFWIGAAVMAVGGLAALLWAVPAEQASLESIATPLTAADEEEAEAGVGHEAEVHPDHRRALEERQRAEEERARAAEHDAAAIELRAESDAHAGERASLEETLADVARARARMHDALADANDEREEAEAAGEAERAAADERVSAAVQRAWASHQEAEALAAGDAGEERRFGEYAEAAREASRARSQRADAAEARARAAGLEGAAAAREEAMADVHDAWTRVHEARSRLHERHADGGALGDEEEIAHLEAAARAAEERLHAAEFRVAADEAGGEAADEADRERRQQERADRERRARERDDRIRNRIDRRNRRERAGLRRYRPGPGSTFYSPGMIGTPVGSSSRTTEEAIDSAVETLANVLRERGEMSREDLARAAGARYWGPGVFRAALREAEQDGAVRRVSRSTYGPSDGR